MEIEAGFSPIGEIQTNTEKKGELRPETIVQTTAHDALVGGRHIAQFFENLRRTRI